MADGLIDLIAHTEPAGERRIYGVALAQVSDNLDPLGLGRVQLRLPWLPGVEPWARVAVLAAGNNRGTYIIPQVDDEVLVAFEHGDITAPYVIGSLWNWLDRPPAVAPTDAMTKQIIRTRQGHEIVFDDLTQTITITSSLQHKVTLDESKIAVAAAGGGATLTLNASGEITLRANRSIDLDAPTITIQGQTIELEAQASASLNGGGRCEIQASLVTIN